MFTSVTYTPAGIGSASSAVGSSFSGATYVDGNEPITTLVDYYILNEDGSYILNQDGSKIIWATLLQDIDAGSGATGTTYIVGSVI